MRRSIVNTDFQFKARRSNHNSDPLIITSKNHVEMDTKYQFTHISKINEAINNWYQKQTRNGKEISELVLREQAKIINRDLNGDPKFSASGGWYKRWKANIQKIEKINNDSNFEAIESIKESIDPRILFIEPFYTGSHKQLIDTLINEFKKDSELISLPGKKWPWRARCSALTLSQKIPYRESYEILFCSSVLSLAELLGLRPDLQRLKKIVYFHENQLIYPKKTTKDRDFQYGYNQITTCLAADHIIFNSSYNMNSFLNNIDTYLKMMPDCKPQSLISKIKPKSTVIYGPIKFSKFDMPNTKNYDMVHIIWPHRWEFDKNPEDFFSTLFRLKSENLKFKVSVLGESFSEIPEIFNKGKEMLETEINHWGYAKTKEEYYMILGSGNVVVSTAYHEFYGVAMLEAVHCGCYPLAPERLVYPEIFEAQNLYKDNDDLYLRLKKYCEYPTLISFDIKKMSLNLKKYDVETVINDFKSLLSLQIL